MCGAILAFLHNGRGSTSQQISTIVRSVAATAAAAAAAVVVCVPHYRAKLHDGVCGVFVVAECPLYVGDEHTT